MLDFPDEKARTEEIQSTFASEIEFAERFYEYWIFLKKDPGLKATKVPKYVWQLAMMINIQACRQFRSIMELISRGEAICAHVICRTLFETAMALEFVLKSRVYVGVHATARGFKAHLPTDNIAGLKKVFLPRKLRAKLLYARIVLDEISTTETTAKLRGFSKIAKQRKAALDPNAAMYIEQEISSQWYSILTHHPHTYSGLSISKLAELLSDRFKVWYETVYGIQSGLAHSTNVMWNIKIDASGREVAEYASDDDEVRKVIHIGTLMFMVCVFCLQRNIGFGSETENEFVAFWREFEEMYEDS